MAPPETKKQQPHNSRRLARGLTPWPEGFQGGGFKAKMMSVHAALLCDLRSPSGHFLICLGELRSTVKKGL